MRFTSLIASIVLGLTSICAHADGIASAIYRVTLGADPNSFDQQGFSPIQGTVMGANPFGYGSTFGIAQGIAAPNELGIFGNASGIDVSYGVSAAASIEDELSITNGPSNGFLVFYVDIDGSAYTSGLAYGVPVLSVLLSVDGACTALDSNPMAQPSNCGLLHDGINVLSVPYNGSSLVPLNWFFETNDDCDIPLSPPAVSTCVAQSSFLDTAQISGIQVEDVNGNVVSGAEISALSGVNYSLPSSVTPEPSSFILLGSGLLGVLIKSRRLRS